MVRAARNAGVLAVAVVMVIALAVATSAKGGPAPADLLVKTTIYNTAGTTALRVQSDGATQAVYETTVVGKTTTVTSKIFSFSGTVGQDFFLTSYYTSKNAYAASGRTARIDLGDPVGTPLFTPDLGDGQVPVQIGVKCRLATPSAVNMLGMTVNQSVECPGSLRFWARDGQWYRFSFQPENFSTSDQWLVTCTAAGSSGCTRWAITPSGADGTSVNTLLRIDSSGNILEVGSDYRLTFSITVTR